MTIDHYKSQRNVSFDLWLYQTESIHLVHNSSRASRVCRLIFIDLIQVYIRTLTETKRDWHNNAGNVLASNLIGGITLTSKKTLTLFRKYKGLRFDI